jgi:hypothetical protein
MDKLILNKLLKIWNNELISFFKTSMLNGFKSNANLKIN